MQTCWFTTLMWFLIHNPYKLSVMESFTLFSSCKEGLKNMIKPLADGDVTGGNTGQLHIYLESLAMWFLLSANLLRVYSTPSSRLLMKILNRIRPSNDPGGILLITGLQLDLVPFIMALFLCCVPCSSDSIFFNPSNIPEWLIPCLVRHGERGIAAWALFWCLYSCKEVKASVERLDYLRRSGFSA